MEVFHLLIKEGITELYHYFATSSKLTDLGKDHQWLVTSLKERGKKKTLHLAIPLRYFAKKLNLNLLIPLHLNNIRQRIYGAEEHLNDTMDIQLTDCKNHTEKTSTLFNKKLKGKYWEIYRSIYDNSHSVVPGTHRYAACSGLSRWPVWRARR